MATTGAQSSRKVPQDIPGHSYRAVEVARSPVSMRGLDDLKVGAGFTEEDQRYLRLAGESQQPTFSAMDSAHLPVALRSGLDQLSTRNRFAPHQLEEEQG